MNNAARPSVRAQIHPEALEIIDFVEPVIDGYDEYGVPVWRGVSDAAWDKLGPQRRARIEAICKVDFPSTCAILLKVRNKQAGALTPFVFNRAQLVVWNKVARMIAASLTLFIAILKARQLGISTFVLAWEWWNLWRLQDSEVLMIGHQVKLVESFIDAMRRFHEELPVYFRPQLRANSASGRVPKHEIYYADRRTKGVTVVSKNVDTRGLAAPNQHYSEFAFFEEPEDLLLTLMPMLPPVGSLARKRASIFIETTPNGKNYFHTFWQHAKSGQSDWTPIFLPWFVAEDLYSLDPPDDWEMDAEDRALQKRLSHERRKIDGHDVSDAQMYWREAEMANQGWNEDYFDQEFPSNDNDCFLLRSHSVFKKSMRYLQKCVSDAEKNVCEEFAKRQINIPKGTNVVRAELDFEPGPGPFDEWRPKKIDPKLVIRKDGRLSVWSPPQVRHAYCVGIDTAHGLGRDASVGWVLDVTEGKQVAEFWSNTIDLEPFADYMVALGYWYNTALLYPEINSIGSVVMKRMRRVWMYPRVGLEEKWDEPGYKPNKYGLDMTDELKEQLVLKLSWFIRERYLAIASNRTLAELSTFEDDDGTFRASSGSHDDCVISPGLACMAVHQTPRFYSTMTKNRHESIPTAYDLGLSKFTHSETPATLQAVVNGSDPFEGCPPEIRAKLDAANRRSSLIPVNPIRGMR